MTKQDRRPGDLILDRYLPDADADLRDEARGELRAWALLLIRIGERIRAEQSTAPPSPKEPKGATIPKTPAESLEVIASHV